MRRFLEITSDAETESLPSMVDTDGWPWVRYRLTGKGWRTLRLFGVPIFRKAYRP